jgi:hypothetical protein
VPERLGPSVTISAKRSGICATSVSWHSFIVESDEGIQLKQLTISRRLIVSSISLTMLRRSDKARISKPKNGAIDANGTSYDDSKNFRCRGVSVNAKKFLKFRLAVTTAALLLCVVAKLLPNDSSNWPAVPLIRTLGTKKLVSYQCPAVDKKGAIDVANNTQRVYLYQNQIRGQFQNFPLFLQTFRKKTYDQLAFSWEHAKKDNYDWKSRMFDLRDGDSVYESASGIGLNLYQTLEILQEVKGIESLVLYGNDYLDISVEKSNQLYDQAPPHGAIKGQFCQSDSKNLSFVPSNSFDLVFTGYIT